MTTTTKPKRTAAKSAEAKTPPATLSAPTPVKVPPSRLGLHIVGGRGSHMLKPGDQPSAEQLRMAKGRGDYLDQLRAGSTVRGAARRAGLGYSTVQGWRKHDPSFDAEVGEALLCGNATLEDRILKASMTDWRAAERLLQVRDPKRWAPRSKRDMNVNVNLSELSPDEERKRVQELELKLLGRVVTVDEPLPGMTAIEGPETDGDGGGEGE